MTIRPSSRRQSVPQSEEELGALLAERLGFDDLPAEVWDHLFQEGFVNGVLTTPDSRAVADCVREARRFLDVHRELRPRSRRRSTRRTIDEANPLPRGNDTGYAEYFSQHVAAFARRNPAVAEVRQVILGGAFLSEASAKDMLLCPACRVLPVSWFQAQRVDVLRHEGTFVDVSDPVLQAKGLSGAVRVQWAGNTLDVPYPESFWGESSPRAAAHGSIGQTIYINVARSSVLDVIRRASESLTKSYPWKPLDAAVFLLSDTAPLIRPIDITVTAHSRRDPHDPDPKAIDFNFGRITLSIASWLPVDTVAKVYEAVQHKHFGRAPKSRDPEKLKLHDFVIERQAAEPDLTWETLMAEWNRTGPKRKYRDFRQFRRDVARVNRWFRQHPYHSVDRFLSHGVLNDATDHRKRIRAASRGK